MSIWTQVQSLSPESKTEDLHQLRHRVLKVANAIENIHILHKTTGDAVNVNKRRPSRQVNPTSEWILELKMKSSDVLECLKTNVKLLWQWKTQVLELELIRWRRKQQLNMTGHENELNSIQDRCGSLVQLVLDTEQQIQEMIRPWYFVHQERSGLEELKYQIKTMLFELVTLTFIVEKQPPQILEIKKRFAVKLRLLVGGLLDMEKALPQATVCIISELQARALREPRGEELQVAGCGELQNNMALVEFQGANSRCIINFKNIMLLEAEKTNLEGRAAKYALLFRSQFDIRDGQNVHVWAVSLPLVVMECDDQRTTCHATITWDNAFSQPGRIRFMVPKEVTWGQMAEALSLEFVFSTGRGLTEDNLRVLAEKVLRVSVPDKSSELNSMMVSWSQFHEDCLPGTRFTFSEWFYKAVKLVKEYLLELWTRGLIMGFVSRKAAQMLLADCQRGTFLLRFSDSEPGAFTVAFVDAPGLMFVLQPYTFGDMDTYRLVQVVKTLSILGFLYPNVPKKEAFCDFYEELVNTSEPSYEQVMYQHRATSAIEARYEAKQSSPPPTSPPPELPLRSRLISLPETRQETEKQQDKTLKKTWRSRLTRYVHTTMRSFRRQPNKPTSEAVDQIDIRISSDSSKSTETNRQLDSARRSAESSLSDVIDEVADSILLYEADQEEITTAVPKRTAYTSINDVKMQSAGKTVKTQELSNATKSHQLQWFPSHEVGTANATAEAVEAEEARLPSIFAYAPPRQNAEVLASFASGSNVNSTFSANTLNHKYQNVFNVKDKTIEDAIERADIPSVDAAVSTQGDAENSVKLDVDEPSKAYEESSIVNIPLRTIHTNLHEMKISPAKEIAPKRIGNSEVKKNNSIEDILNTHQLISGKDNKNINNEVSSHLENTILYDSNIMTKEADKCSDSLNKQPTNETLQDDILISGNIIEDTSQNSVVISADNSDVLPVTESAEMVDSADSPNKIALQTASQTENFRGPEDNLALLINKPLKAYEETGGCKLRKVADDVLMDDEYTMPDKLFNSQPMCISELVEKSTKIDTTTTFQSEAVDKLVAKAGLENASVNDTEQSSVKEITNTSDTVHKKPKEEIMSLPSTSQTIVKVSGTLNDSEERNLKSNQTQTSAIQSAHDEYKMEADEHKIQIPRTVIKTCDVFAETMVEAAERKRANIVKPPLVSLSFGSRTKKSTFRSD